MKPLLLTLLLLTSAAQADQWLVNGRTYKGTIHKFNADRTLIWVTSDWDNYGGSWIKVTELDPATRVRLHVATPHEEEIVQAQMEQQQKMEAEAAAQAEKRAIENRAARIEEEKLAIERGKLELQRQQEARHLEEMRRRAQRAQSPQVIIVPIFPAPQGNTQNIPTGVPQVPRVPRVPQVRPVQPIIIRYN
ncbi:hypothetical protein [Prosthecobacter sp.]|uniref:hypothetical protein n=1 Tax=Prosthecobacter sp. TaxID=1965333 RepID=UPI0024879560|nr:hypothetical protein [Prosthecobacter sp.]MDI1313267.1 hypothetical protein [Prosthecobacter sp.]